MDNKGIVQVNYYKLSMPKIFISYRRADSEIITGRIYDRLIQAFNSEDVFKDVDNIPPGKDFRGVLREATAQCDIMLVIIGLDWLTVTDDNGNRRLDDPEDFVRLEVETGLLRDSVTVIPVLVKGAKPPHASELPDSLKQLAYNNAFIIHNDPHFSGDVQRLISKIQPENMIEDEPDTGKENSGGLDPRIVTAIITGVVAIIVAIIGILPEFLNTPGGNQHTSLTATYETQLAAETQTAIALTIVGSETRITLSETPAAPTATHTMIPTNTDIPATTNTLVPAPTNIEIPIPSYPCEGQVIGVSGLLNQVRRTPLQSSQLIEPVEQGGTIEILNYVQNDRTEWYEINYGDSNTGWLEVRFVQASQNCPSE